MAFNEMKYVQIIKTTDAEIKGYRNLSYKTKEKITPLFELTRSRTSTKVPEGDIKRRIEHIKEAVEGLPFILDLTSHEDLANYQIEDLLDDQDGFTNWVEFIHSLKIDNIIPALHVYPDEDSENIQIQARNLAQKFNPLALRFNYDDPHREKYLQVIRDSVPESQIICILDGGYIKNEQKDSIVENVNSLMSTAILENPNFRFCFAASSFPSSVTSLPTCDDSEGVIPLLEWEIYCSIKKQGHDIIYGDYASIHPVRYQSRGGSWVPRVDYALSYEIRYKRFRRDEGGYARAASQVQSSDYFDNIPCWGSEQIAKAAQGKPEGKSPSFWISVRVNIHSTRKVSDLY